MVKVVAAVAVVLMFLAQGAWAQTVDGQAAVGRQAEDALAQAMARNPERFEAGMIDLVAGFGGPDGLTLAGIKEHVALERAGARASALRRFLAMDLDADGSVTRAELAVTQRAVSAAARGRLERQFAAADADGNGQADPAEIAADGRAAALRAVDEAEATLLRSAMSLDADGDGALTVAEVQSGVQRAMARMDEAT